MIEVEKKLNLTAEEEARLLHGATFLGEKTFTDIYYDTADYALTREDKWLRERDGKWELKINRNRSLERLGDQYDEIVNIPEILSRLNLDSRFNLDRGELKKIGYLPFATVTTTRGKYKKDGYTIDLDIVTYADTGFIYRLAEIETEATDEAHMDEVLKELIAFIEKEGIELRRADGKIGAYLRTVKPAHAEALIVAGVFRKHI